VREKVWNEAEALGGSEGVWIKGWVARLVWTVTPLEVMIPTQVTVDLACPYRAHAPDKPGNKWIGQDLIVIDMDSQLS
jgi:hypothetical protein